MHEKWTNQAANLRRAFLYICPFRFVDDHDDDDDDGNLAALSYIYIQQTLCATGKIVSLLESTLPEYMAESSTEHRFPNAITAESVAHDNGEKRSTLGGHHYARFRCTRRNPIGKFDSVWCDWIYVVESLRILCFYIHILFDWIWRYRDAADAAPYSFRSSRKCLISVGFVVVVVVNVTRRDVNERPNSSRAYACDMRQGEFYCHEIFIWCYISFASVAHISSTRTDIVRASRDVSKQPRRGWRVIIIGWYSRRQQGPGFCVG